MTKYIGRQVEFIELIQMQGKNFCVTGLSDLMQQIITIFRIMISMQKYIEVHIRAQSKEIKPLLN